MKKNYKQEGFGGVLWLTVKQSNHLYGLSVNVPASAVQEQHRRGLMHEKEKCIKDKKSPQSEINDFGC